MQLHRGQPDSVSRRENLLSAKPLQKAIAVDMEHIANTMQNRLGREFTESPLAIGLHWWGLALLIASADQVTKYAVQAQLPYGVSIPIADFFNIVHRWNTGAAFSFLANAGGWQRYFLTAIALTVSCILGWMLTKPRRISDAISYSLILGGALGNVVDRLGRGYVVDFLDFYWRSFHWPAFNFADMAVCVGAIMLVAGGSSKSTVTTG